MLVTSPLHNVLGNFIDSIFAHGVYLKLYEVHILTDMWSLKSEFDELELGNAFVQVEKREFQHEVHILTAMRSLESISNVLLGIHLRSQFVRYSLRRANSVNHTAIFGRVKVLVTFPNHTLKFHFNLCTLIFRSVEECFTVL